MGVDAQKALCGLWPQPSPHCSLIGELAADHPGHWPPTDQSRSGYQNPRAKGYREDTPALGKKQLRAVGLIGGQTLVSRQLTAQKSAVSGHWPDGSVVWGHCNRPDPSSVLCKVEMTREIATAAISRFGVRFQPAQVFKPLVNENKTEKLHRSQKPEQVPTDRAVAWVHPDPSNDAHPPGGLSFGPVLRVSRGPRIPPCNCRFRVPSPDPVQRAIRADRLFQPSLRLRALCSQSAHRGPPGQLVLVTLPGLLHLD